jgi:hypothetical protein
VKIDQRFLDHNWIAILVLKSVSDFYFRIAIMIAIENLIRIDRDPVLVRKSIGDFSVKFFSRLTALGGSAKAPPPPRGHPPHCDCSVLLEVDQRKNADRHLFSYQPPKSFLAADQLPEK